MMNRDDIVAGISEVVLRVEDIGAMRDFYVDVVGLEPWNSSPGFVFLKVVDVDTPLGRGSHPQVVALVDREERPWEWPGIDYRRPDPAASSLDHLAFEVRPGTLASERTRLQELGLEVQTVEFPWLEARGLFFRDPEGNVVEFLAHEPGLGAEAGPTIDRLLETFLVVERLERACEFYGDVLALEPYDEPGERGCLFRLPGGQLLGLVAREAAAEPNELPGGTVPAVLPHEDSGGGMDRLAARPHRAFAVAADELDAWHRRLEAHGVEPEGEVTWERGGRSLYFRDPDGHLLEMASPGLWDFY